MKHYLIKRNSYFSEKSYVKKGDNKNKGYNEKKITSNKSMPDSNKFKKGDMIYVAEKGNGIWSKGELKRKSEVIEFKSTYEIVQYIKSTKRKDDSRWLQLIKEFEEKKAEKNVVLKFQEYIINQELLYKVIPLTGKLSRLSKQGNASSVIMLNNEEIKFLKDPAVKEVKINKLKGLIPPRLKTELSNLFNTKMTLSHWVDIDHFVPMSSGGPGNIIENLVPINFSINRYKSNSIPTGLFKIASEKTNLRKFCKPKFLEKHPYFLRKKQNPSAFENAVKINDLIKKLEIEEAKEFYLQVLKLHHPGYVEIIDKVRKEMT
jgi:hypothetical protein